ncbi:hypothetical protein [Bradyrhizobium uaiense]|uniref:Uncharacterized protein n=1 Tax=Bradyrhizobium uaiense TaxID=2594946 RepID=A0A6P1BQ15_9BRAD|nr:hypothetical protein [Bradyrhizobium uaiense]NEV00325.1 hypothetical protein [Bradyrhizobium uaiense]
MKAEHLAAYFQKKIAKAIPYNVFIPNGRGQDPVYWVYELEVTAVDGEDVHMMVTQKGVREVAGRWLMRHDVTRGDIVIPLQDGDVVTLVLGMAVAIRGLPKAMHLLTRSDSLHICYREYGSRCEGYNNTWSPPRT